MLRRPSSAATSAPFPRPPWSGRRWWPSCSPTRFSRSSAATPSTRSRSTTPRRPTSSAIASRPRVRPQRRRADIAHMIRPILRYGADVLHAPAAPVEELTPDLQRLIDDMIQTMYAAPGIGLAAPQVGVAVRIFVCDISVGRNPQDLLAFINPEFVERD